MAGLEIVAANENVWNSPACYVASALTDTEWSHLYIKINLQTNAETHSTKKSVAMTLFKEGRHLMHYRMQVSQGVSEHHRHHH